MNLKTTPVTCATLSDASLLPRPDTAPISNSTTIFWVPMGPQGSIYAASKTCNAEEYVLFNDPVNTVSAMTVSGTQVFFNTDRIKKINLTTGQITNLTSTAQPIAQNFAVASSYLYFSQQNVVKRVATAASGAITTIATEPSGSVILSIAGLGSDIYYSAAIPDGTGKYTGVIKRWSGGVLTLEASEPGYDLNRVPANLAIAAIKYTTSKLLWGDGTRTAPNGDILGGIWRSLL